VGCDVLKLGQMCISVLEGPAVAIFRIKLYRIFSETFVPICQSTRCHVLKCVPCGM
jgi:hypothetical protein